MQMIRMLTLNPRDRKPSSISRARLSHLKKLQRELSLHLHQFAICATKLDISLFAHFGARSLVAQPKATNSADETGSFEWLQPQIQLASKLQQLVKFLRPKTRSNGSLVVVVVVMAIEFARAEFR